MWGWVIVGIGTVSGLIAIGQWVLTLWRRGVSAQVDMWVTRPHDWEATKDVDPSVVDAIVTVRAGAQAAVVCGIDFEARRPGARRWARLTRGPSPIPTIGFPGFPCRVATSLSEGWHFQLVPPFLDDRGAPQREVRAVVRLTGHRRVRSVPVDSTFGPHVEG
jgi:hypothetical protein